MHHAKSMKAMKLQGGNPIPGPESQMQVAGDPVGEEVENFAPFSGGKGKSAHKKKGKSMKKRKTKTKTMKRKGKTMRKYNKKGGFVSAEVATPVLLLAANVLIKKSGTRKHKK